MAQKKKAEVVVKTKKKSTFTINKQIKRWRSQLTKSQFKLLVEADRASRDLTRVVFN